MVRLCYSIYKVQFCSFWILLSAANFYILSQSVSFVKNFFRSFSNFFLSRCPPGKPFIGQLEYAITDVFVCQDVSSSFSNFFCSLSSRQAVHQTADIYYHSLIVLSSTNFTFFDLFCTSSFRHRSTTLLLISASASAASETLLSC